MAIVGARSSNAANSNAFVSLQQTIISSNKKGANLVGNANIQNYLYPNTLSGILIMLFIVLIMVIGFLQLMSVQTPLYFPTDKMDFGKIEQWAIVISIRHNLFSPYSHKFYIIAHSLSRTMYISIASPSIYY